MPSRSVLSQFHIDGRAILLTGATGHLGRPIARAIAQAGGTSIVAGRSQQSLDQLVSEIEQDAGNAHAINLDVGDPDQCRRAVGKIGDLLGKLDGIVNCAYSGSIRTIETSLDSDFELAWRVTLGGPFAIVQAALPLLRAAAPGLAGGASIVNIASMYGRVSPDPRIYGTSGKNSPPHYGAAKAGLLQLTRYLAAHLAPDGIRVNSVSPGPFPPQSIAQTDPDFHAKLCYKTPLGRIGVASELTGPVVFLLSEAASFVTGADLAVDGGWTAW
jgi:NAD(P)-dependent dehydrogenase (short-subunit alcohol dehydrogenase family)